MRTLRIDFTSGSMLPDGNFAGRMGEHNATELIVTPPEEMTQCEGISKYVVAFMTEGKLIRTDFYPKAESFTVPLFSQLTQDHCLGLQLEGYDTEGNLLVKSPVIDNLRLEPSASGDSNIEAESGSGSLVSDIILNTEARHTHDNRALLDSISKETFNEIRQNSLERHYHPNGLLLDTINEGHFADIKLNSKERHRHTNSGYLEKVREDVDGTLIYNGNRYAREKKTKTVELSIWKEQAGVIVENMMLFFYVNLDYYTYSNTESPIKLGDKIVKVEFDTDFPEYPEWVDATTLFQYNIYSPCNVFMDEAFLYDYKGSLYFLIMDFYTGKTHRFHTDAWLGLLNLVRITLLDESEN